MSYVTLALNEIDELHSTIELQNDANFFEKYMHANTAETILSNFEYVQKCWLTPMADPQNQQFIIPNRPDCVTTLSLLFKDSLSTSS